MPLRNPRLDWILFLRLAAMLCLGLLSASLALAIQNAGGLP
ncbi:MAG: hypothetical protein ACYCYF_10490 [Anaerolineae bacterium]